MGRSWMILSIKKRSKDYERRNDGQERKPKKEKNPKEKVPLDKAAKKKRRRIIFACIAGVLIVALW